MSRATSELRIISTTRQRSMKTTMSNLEKRGWKVKKLMYNMSEFDCKGEKTFNFSEKSPVLAGFKEKRHGKCTKMWRRSLTLINMKF